MSQDTPTRLEGLVGQLKHMGYAEVVDQRIVPTHDKHGLSLSFGNRQARRSVIKNRGTGGKPKQFHKQGH